MALDNVRATGEVSDNRESGNTLTPLLPITPTESPSLDVTRQSSNDSSTPASNITPPSSTAHMAGDPYDSVPSDPWHLTFTELRAMRLELQAIATRTASTESKVASNSEQIKGMGEQFLTLKESLNSQQQKTDSNVSNNSSKIQQMGEQIQSLQTTINSQQQTIQELQKVKQDFANTKEEFTQSSAKTISEMNKLLEQQRQQVHTLRDIRKNINQDAQKQKDELKSFKSDHTDIQKDVQRQFKQAADDRAFKELKDQAFKNQHNIVITGLPEHESYDDYSVASHFFRTKLKLKKLYLETTYRRGQTPANGGSYIRPLVVTFSWLRDRNLVWRRRNNIPQTDGNQRIKIQADLPKALREDVSVLYRVLRAAASIEEFKTASVRDYSVVLNGKHYAPSQLETLPIPLRPSSLATKQSDQALAFFTKFSFLSNHSPSTFTYQNKVFNNMEQFLAFRRAETCQQHELADRALRTQDPVEAKYILNSLRNDHEQEWQSLREEIAAEGLREKFTQNPALADYLKSTQGRQLAEASKNPE